jgi:hypothetical protein
MVPNLAWPNLSLRTLGLVAIAVTVFPIRVVIGAQPQPAPARTVPQPAPAWAAVSLEDQSQPAPAWTAVNLHAADVPAGFVQRSGTFHSATVTASWNGAEVPIEESEVSFTRTAVHGPASIRARVTRFDSAVSRYTMAVPAVEWDTPGASSMLADSFASVGEIRFVRESDTGVRSEGDRYPVQSILINFQRGAYDVEMRMNGPKGTLTIAEAASLARIVDARIQHTE